MIKLCKYKVFGFFSAVKEFVISLIWFRVGNDKGIRLWSDVSVEDHALFPSLIRLASYQDAMVKHCYVHSLGTVASNQTFRGNF